MKKAKFTNLKLILAVLALIALVGYYVFFYYSTCGFYEGMKLKDNSYNITGLIPEDLRDTSVSLGPCTFFKNRAGNVVYVEIGTNDGSQYVVTGASCLDKRFMSNSRFAFSQLSAGMSIKDMVRIVGIPARFGTSCIHHPDGNFYLVFEGENGEEYFINLAVLLPSTHSIFGTKTYRHNMIARTTPRMRETSKDEQKPISTFPLKPYILPALLTISVLLILMILLKNGFLRKVIHNTPKKTRRIILYTIGSIAAAILLIHFFVKPYDTCGIRVGDQINVRYPETNLPPEIADSCYTDKNSFFCFRNKAGNIIYIQYNQEGTVTDIEYITSLFTSNAPISYRQLKTGMTTADVIKLVGLHLDESGDFLDTEGGTYDMSWTSIQKNEEETVWLLQIVPSRKYNDSREDVLYLNLRALILSGICAVVLAILFVRLKNRKTVERSTEQTMPEAVDTPVLPEESAEAQEEADYLVLPITPEHLEDSAETEEPEYLEAQDPPSEEEHLAFSRPQM